MKITIFNGNPDAENSKFDGYFDSLQGLLEKKGHSVVNYKLRENDIHPCTACFVCFVRTPGICVFKDKASDYVKSHVNSDISLFVSPLLMGLPTYLLKCVQDRLCPALLPMKHVVHGGVHQKPRYPNQSVFSVMVDIDDGIHGEEDAERVFRLFEYFGENYDTRTVFKATTKMPVNEVADALSNI